MEKKDVEILATLLKKPSEDVQKALDNGGIEPLVSEFTTNHQMFTADEYTKLVANVKDRTIANLKEEDIPDSYKSKAVGWKLGDMEEELKKEYQFTDEHKGLIDLVKKIVTKAGSPADQSEEVKTLKETITTLEDDFKTKLEAKQKEFDTTLIKSDFRKAIRNAGLDYEGDTLKKQNELLEGAFYRGGFDVIKKDGKTVVTKEGEIVADSKLDPKPLDEVMANLAKDYGFQLKTPDTGGHGGKSSKSQSGLKSLSWNEYLEKNDVRPNTDEADKLYAEWKKAQ